MAKVGRPKKWTEEKAIELGNELIEWLEASEDNVFFEEFLIMHKKLYREIIRDLTHQYDAFSQMIKRAKQLQEMKLQRRLMEGKGNPVSLIFILKNVANWADKRETKSEVTKRDVSNSDLKDMTEDQIQEAFREMARKNK